MTWTKKHDEFLQASNISGCAELLTRWQLRRAKLNEPSEIEIDLRQFNKWISKNRLLGEYHRKTLINAQANLCDRSNGMFTIMKKYSPYVYKILVRPLSFLSRIESAKCASSSTLPNVKPMFDAASKEREENLLLQNISKLDTLLKNVGMSCNTETLHRMWRCSGKKIEEVAKAIEYMLFTHTNKLMGSVEGDVVGIRNPIAWLVSCLKFNRQDDYDPYYQTDLPVFSSTQDIEKFVRGIMPQSESPPNLS